MVLLVRIRVKECNKHVPVTKLYRFRSVAIDLPGGGGYLDRMKKGSRLCFRSKKKIKVKSSSRSLLWADSFTF